MRIDQLTFTRFIAALAIVIFHFGSAIFPFNNEHITFLVHYANMGVSYFFVLSGFIMIIAYNRFTKIDTADYLRNRFARVYPLIVVSVLPFALAVVLFPGTITISEILFNLSTIQAWIPGYATVGNYPLWSLTVEIFFYLCFPLLFNRVYKKYSLSTLTIVVIAIWFITIFVQNYLLNQPFYKGNLTPLHDLIYYFPPMHLNQFLIGNIAGLYVVNQAVGLKRKYDIFVILTLTALVLLLKYPLAIDYHDGFLAWIFAAFIVVMSQNTGVISKIFSIKPLIFLGEISFAVYVLQVPVFETCTKLIEKFKITDNTTAIFYFNLFVLLVASAICHIFIELPLRNKIKNIRLKPLLKS